MTFHLENTVALVTGANRGIGKVIVETLLEEGVRKVYAAVRDVETVSELAAAYPERVIAMYLDLSIPETIEAAAQVASDVTLVVNNAGVLKTATALSPEAIDFLRYEIEINVFGLMRVAQAFAPVLKANGGGGFVQINSVASLKSFPEFATYCASKAASYSISQALKAMFETDGIQMVSVHPGPIATEMAEHAGIGHMAESPKLVATAIIDALVNKQFHTFPDSMAKRFGQAYAPFAESIVESGLVEE